MAFTRLLLAGLLGGLICLPGLNAAQKQRDEGNTRSIQGIVEDPAGNPVEGAIVQLKNRKTLQVRSFITQKGGAYYFHGLSMDADYELRAEHEGRVSNTRTVSVFDSRRKVIINLKLEDKK